MILKILIFISYYIRKLINIVFGFYLLILVFLNGSIYNGKLPIFYFFVFIFITGLFIGINLMIIVIKFLNSKNTIKNPYFRRIVDKAKKQK